MTNRDDVISFSAGISAVETDPVEAFRGIEEELIRQPYHEALKHTPTEGFWALREAIADLMQKRGVGCSPDEVLVLSGSQQGIDMPEDRIEQGIMRLADAMVSLQRS